MADVINDDKREHTKDTPSEGTVFEQKLPPVFPSVGNDSPSRHAVVDQLYKFFKRFPRKDPEEELPQSDQEDKGKEENPIHDQRQESLMKMQAINKKSSNVLFYTKTVFPFDLFPNELTVTSTKIEAKIYTFFYTYTTITIPLQDIGYVDLQASIFFSTLVIFNIRSQKAVVLRYLWNKDGDRGKKIINGLLVAQESGVDVSVVEPKKLLPQLEGLGA